MVSHTNSNFSVVKSSPFSSSIVSIIHDSPLAIQLKKHLILKFQSQHIAGLLCTAPCFLKGKKLTDHCSILAVEAIGFFSKLLPPWGQGKYQRYGTFKFH